MGYLDSRHIKPPDMGPQAAGKTALWCAEAHKKDALHPACLKAYSIRDDLCHPQIAFLSDSTADRLLAHLFTPSIDLFYIIQDIYGKSKPAILINDRE
ncbi:MAG: hypothetical protein IKP32_05130 [Clostridia bacterium]|nr:hypothetical protein [Clostridia bacterium]